MIDSLAPGTILPGKDTEETHGLRRESNEDVFRVTELLRSPANCS